ncbi:MAG: AAA family ATPase [Planctomycetota bacterium]|nr:MAG: AAA family ATPase [Planctomycetota bacterium]
MSHRLSILNEAQREAVTTLSGPLLVLAGAGTGKTRVITYRMAELIRSGVRPERILSVTFTNKAAKEMLERTKHLLGGLKQRPWISTFHSLCVNVLRSDIEVLGYPAQFTILDRGDQESIGRSVLRDIRVAESSLKPSDLLSIISKWKSVGIRPDRAKDAAEDDKEFLAAMAYRKYQARLKSTGGVDFDDLLLLTNELFNNHPEILARHQRRFDHVQVDEYQDTNGTQFELIEALVREHQNLCVVGDDDQSIYGWRGAEVRHILGFGQYFPGSKTVRLEENYRCTDAILEMANELVRHNRQRHKKTLRATKKAREDVRFKEFEDEQIEAEMVVREIKFYIQQKGVPARDFCILFRTNEQPRVFEQELRRAGVPYLLMGSQSFYDRKEVKDILCYLRVLASPVDEAALLRVINTPPRGIGEASVEKVLTRAVHSGRSFFETVPIALQEGEITVKAAGAMQAFQEKLHRFRQRFEEQPRAMVELTREMIESFDYHAEIERQYKEPHQQLARQASLDEFINSIGQYLERTPEPDLAEYLSTVALEGREDEPDKEKQAQEDAVKLMTLHSAKGLEFPRVYMVGLEEGILPHKRSVDGTEENIAEERRLCYVGVTRAQDYLTLTRAASRMKWGKRRQSVPSRFLKEMRGKSSRDEDEDSDI